ncbi:hypothetical protein [Bradyrhizobium sp. 18]|uniref:hypothetical protein n=1 Tax=Bradyrhizobium sp. 18 TaxID=2782657 RepID=UPI001FFBE663|nr:hypothetical protein [Bradyrhizobium sp. 18]MCK1507579.1 hypothetical protein [Bradyrhizobium sp. 18]
MNPPIAKAQKAMNHAPESCGQVTIAHIPSPTNPALIAKADNIGVIKDISNNGKKEYPQR